MKILYHMTNFHHQINSIEYLKKDYVILLDKETINHHIVSYYEKLFKKDY